MTDSDAGQLSLTDAWSDGDDGDRPDEEAQAVADDLSSGASVVDTDREGLPDADGYLDVAVTQVDYTIEGRGENEEPIIHVFGRTPEDQTAVHVKVYGFQPYFYAPVDAVTDERIAEFDGLVGYDVANDDDEPFESIRGDELAKIYGRTPRDVGNVRDQFEHYEADILFPNRFLIDKDVNSGLRVPNAWNEDETAIRVHHEDVAATEATVTPRVNTFDIEVDDRNGFPEDGEEEIVCLTSHDSYRDEYVCWLQESSTGESVTTDDIDYDPIPDAMDYRVETFEREEAMLEAFLDYVAETDPDVTTGWNFEDFDAPYFLDRLDELASPSHDYDLDANRLSRVNEVWRSGWGGPDVKGRVVFDLLYAYKSRQFTELDSYRLDAVGETELDVGKERYSGDIGDLWEQDPTRLLEYNLRDVELCVELDRKQDIVAFYDEVRTFVGCKLEDAPTAGDAVDMYVLHKVNGEFALPSKGQQESEDYEGGAVFDPITGVKENVTVLDLKCFSPDTDVLTPNGSRNIAEIEEGEEIYTLNPETFECETTRVAETHEYQNSFGELHHLSGNTHDFKITENHRLMHSKERGWDEQSPEDFVLEEYRNIPENERFAFPQHEPMDGERPETFDLIDQVDDGNVVIYYDSDLREFRHRVPDAVTDELELVHGSSAQMGHEKSVGKYLLSISTYRDYRESIDELAQEVFLKYAPQHRETHLCFEMKNWLELIGWYVTEGSVEPQRGRFTIHQDNQACRRAISELLEEMEINHSVDERGFNISNAYLTEWFVDNCGKGYADKQLPDWVFDLDSELLRELLDTMIRGDGSRAASGLGKFWTKSPSLKDDFVRAAVRCGEKPTVSLQSDGTWYVSAGKRGSFKKATNGTVEPDDGTVHCITAEENHVILAGRNGNFQWIGQSLYPMCMVTVNASPETKVDPESYDGETFVAPNGTHFRKEPDGMIREMVDELLGERENKKALRNEHDPGTVEYETYDQQQAAVKVIMNCFSSDTDVLTPEGVRNICDLEVGDDVYSLDPDSMEMEVKPVVETHEYPDYRDEMVDIETSKIDFSVTPNHRMLVRKDDENGESWDDFQFVEAGELNESSHYELPHDWDGPDGDRLDVVDLTALLDGDYEVWCDNDVHGHTLKGEVGYYPDKMEKQGEQGTGYVFDADEFEEHREYLDEHCSTFYVHAERGRKWIPRYYDGDDFLELLAWYITEGNVYTSDDKQFGENFRGSATTVQIAQDAVEADAVTDGGESDDHATIGSLLERMGFDASVDDRGYQFTSKLLGEYLEDVCGDDSFAKRIPEFVFDLATEQKRRFLNTLIAGDGDRQTNSWRYTTSSERLRDDVLRLCTHLGLTASVNRDSGSWRIYCTEGGKNSFRMHRSGSTSTADDGAYCVTVEDNHTLLAGRNGTFQFVGQSLYGVLGWDRFRLYDKEMGAAVTATGREVIEHTETAANEIGHEVAYGDTDSIMIELGPEVSTDEAIEQSFDIEEHINDSYDEFAREELDAYSHRFQIEFEKLYRRFFQAGKKKRYAGHIVWKEGKDVDDVDITGFEYKRSDIAPVTKEVQREVIERIVYGEDLENIRSYVSGVIDDFLAGEYSYDEIAIPGGIGKKLDAYETDTAQVRGAKYANELFGTNFSSGSKPKRLYLEGVHPSFFERVEEERGLDPREDPLYGEFKRDPDVICFEYDDQIPEAFSVDYEKMLDKTLKGPIERVIEALGMSWDEVKTGQEQTGLGSFM